MDDFHRDGFPPRRWIPGGFHDHPDTRANTNPPAKKQRQGHSAADLRLSHDILSRLSRRGSHPSEWELITREEALYNLRASDHIAIFRRTRKGWEPLKALNGVPTGEEIIALRRRTIPKRQNHGGAQTMAERFAYDNTVRQLFFHRRLSSNAGIPPGYQPRHISLREWDAIMATAVPTKPANHWVGLVLRDANGQPAAGYPYRLRDSSGAIRQGQLNAQGESQVNGLADGPVDITFGQPVEDPAIQAQRQQVKQELKRILQAEREEAARIESEQRQRSLLGKAMAYQGALSKGTGEALWGILSGVKELTDLGTQHLNNALGAAWETWRHADEERYLQTFLEQFEEAEFQELIDVLGIDPRSITREQWAEAQSLLNFLWHDDETQAQLIDFAKDYVDAQHGLEIAETGAGMVTEIAMDILITALTLGMGATLAVTAKVRHANKLGSLGKALKQLAQKLKQKAGSKQAQSQTGTWLYEDLEKPDHKTIEPRDGLDGGEYDGAVEELAPNNLLRFTAEQADNLKGLVRTEFEKLMGAKQAGQLTNAELGPALSVAQDLRTGQLSQVWRNNSTGEAPANLSEVLTRRWANAPDEILAFERTHGMASHSEVYAVNELLNARPDASLQDFAVFTVETKMSKYRGEFKPACAQCNWLLEGVQYVK